MLTRGAHGKATFQEATTLLFERVFRTIDQACLWLGNAAGA